MVTLAKIARLAAVEAIGHFTRNLIKWCVCMMFTNGNLNLQIRCLNAKHGFELILVGMIV